MSRFAPVKSAPVPKRDPRTGAVGAQDDVCPVCKSSRYLNPSIRFLVNPECYHKMCESCVDRIFSHGPATCPIKGCGRTLRKHRFREQTFEDIQVEREVDIRKKVAAVFNRREDDFESLLAYNNYLNDVEDITFNMINKIDVDATQKKFEAYQRAHESEISQNSRLAEQESQRFSALQKLERQHAKERRAANAREEEEMKREVEENKRDVLNRMAAGEDAETVAREGQKVQLKKRMDRQTAAERQRALQAAAEPMRNGVVIKGLKSKQKVEDMPAVDPFGGLRLVDRYFSLQDDYVWEGYQGARENVKSAAGGFDAREYAHRALSAAFSGLGVFVADEVMERERVAQEGEAVGTARADVGLKDAGLAEAR